MRRVHHRDDDYIDLRCSYAERAQDMMRRAQARAEMRGSMLRATAVVDRYGCRFTPMPARAISLLFLLAR